MLPVVNVTFTIGKARKSLRANGRTQFELLLNGKTDKSGLELLTVAAEASGKSRVG